MGSRWFKPLSPWKGSLNHPKKVTKNCQVNLLINGIYWCYKPFTNHLLTSWDIQANVSRQIFLYWQNPEFFRWHFGDTSLPIHHYLGGFPDWCDEFCPECVCPSPKFCAIFWWHIDFIIAIPLASMYMVYPPALAYIWLIFMVNVVG